MASKNIINKMTKYRLPICVLSNLKHGSTKTSVIINIIKMGQVHDSYTFDVQGYRIVL